MPPKEKQDVSDYLTILSADGTTYSFPLYPVNPERHPGSAKGLVWMSDDFDDPLEDFAEYM